MKKFLFITTIFFTFISHAYSYDPLQFEKDELEFLHQQYDKKTYDLRNLKEIKYLIINGNIGEAKKKLKLYKEQGRLPLIPSFYQALISFIENNYQESHNIIESKLKNNFNGYSESCLLDIYNLLQLGLTKDIERKFYKCAASNAKWSPTNHFWGEIIIKRIKNDALFKENRLSKLFVNFEDLNEDVWSLWTKSAIYYHKETEFENVLGKYPDQLFLSNKIKEILGFIYFRLKDFKLADDFFRDVSTVNSENIMATIYISEQKWELALGHLLIALKHKSNSINAVNRLTPLYWILEDYEKGIEIAEKIPTTQENLSEKLLLTSSFLLKNKNYKQTLEKFNIIRKIYGESPPKKALQMAIPSYLMTEDYAKFRKYSEKGCLKNDPISCHSYAMSFIWPNLGKMISNKTEIDISEKELSFNEIINSKKEDPLNEISYIRQVDIEELDESLYETGLN